jgi:hypothetical protein
MELEVTAKRIRIKPENIQDQVYIQHVLGLRKNGDSIPLVCFATCDGKFILDLTAGKFSKRKRAK